MLDFSQALYLFGGYAAVILIVVYLRRDKKHQGDDFLVMQRKLGVTRGSLSIAVSWIWAPAVFICSLQAYTQGLPGIFWFTLPNILTFFVFVPIALRLRKRLPDGYTISQLFSVVYPEDRRPHYASMIVSFGYQLGAIIINCVAGATLINLLAGIPFSVGVLMMAGLALAYSLISGLRASVQSDVIQMLMILTVAFVIVPLVYVAAGGFDTLRAGLGGVSGEFRNIFDPGVAFAFGIATSIGLISGPVADQMFSQRAFAAKKGSIVPIFIIGGLLFGIVPILLSLLGFIGAGSIISGAELVVSDPQMVGPEVVAHFLPSWALMLFAVMAFAGLTSTLDSAFSAIGSLWAVDVHGVQKKDDKSVAIPTARKGMMLFAGIGVAIALLQPQLLWVFLIYGALAAALFFPVVMTLFGTKPKSDSVFLGIAAGILFGTPLSIYANVSGNTNLIVISALIGLLVPAFVIFISEKIR